ncbi:MAG: hypothetical protein GYB65_19570, partial [Chloroflexi bacterium]|nr:hypothetical protein [Chloroflexota bacterium]
MAHRRRRHGTTGPLGAGYPQYEWAFDADGEPVHISQAKRGTIHYCPMCDGRLVAKRGEVKQHHFAHEEIRDCPPDVVARLAAQRWLVRALERAIEQQQPVVITWRCLLCQQQHTVDLLSETTQVWEDVPIGDWQADVALLDGHGRVHAVIAVDPLEPEILVQHASQQLTTLVLNLDAFRHGMTDLARLFSHSSIHGLCSVQTRLSKDGVVADTPGLRRALIDAVTRPPYHVYGPLSSEGDLTHVFDLNERKLWLPPILWERAIGGVLHSISPTLQILSQEWLQKDGSTIALYYVTVKDTHAVAVRRFPPGQAVYARLDTSLFRT